MKDWFLSPKRIADDMPPGEVGDDWKYILNIMQFFGVTESGKSGRFLYLPRMGRHRFICKHA
jgi:hypothetical protein